jgi:DNA-binding LacI/PurR family transcriptional regulator
MMSIREVARKAGVGIGTVSRVLNGRASVSAEVQRRVLEVVKELKYTPNVHARRMWRGRANTICFVLANRQILLSLHGHIFRGVEEFCSVNGYSVLFTTFRYSPHAPAEELELPPILKSKGIVDGVILGGVNYPNLLQRMAAAGLPCSVFGNNLVVDGAAPGNVVMFEDRDGAEQAVEYLIRLGHRDIWFVGQTQWPWNRRRYESYLTVMKRHGLKARAVIEGLANAGHELGLQAARRILEGAEPATAIFAASDYIACGVIEAATRIGCRVPRDLSVIGFDALDEFAYYRPRITSVGTDKEKIGEYCALLVIRQIDGEDPGEQSSMRIPMHLVEGDSCAPPPASTRAT